MLNVKNIHLATVRVADPTDGSGCKEVFAIRVTTDVTGDSGPLVMNMRDNGDGSCTPEWSLRVIDVSKLTTAAASRASWIEYDEDDREPEPVEKSVISIDHR